MNTLVVVAAVVLSIAGSVLTYRAVFFTPEGPMTLAEFASAPSTHVVVTFKDCTINYSRCVRLLQSGAPDSYAYFVAVQRGIFDHSKPAMLLLRVRDQAGLAKAREVFRIEELSSSSPELFKQVNFAKLLAVDCSLTGLVRDYRSLDARTGAKLTKVADVAATWYLVDPDESPSRQPGLTILACGLLLLGLAWRILTA